MKLFNRFITYFIVISLTPIPSLACSVLTLADSSESLTGYTMDWTASVKPEKAGGRNFLGGGIFLLNSGVQKKPAFNKKSKLTWTSKYRSLVLSILGPAYAFNGINEKGLEIYELGAPTLNKEATSEKPTVSEGDLFTLMLDLAANTDEAIEIAKAIRMEQFLFPIQYYIKDSTGKAVILDYKNGLRVHTTLPKEQSVTNHYYDSERTMLKEGTRPTDSRFIYIAENAKTPKDVEPVITKVGTKSDTMWQTFSSVRSNQRLYTIRVNSHLIEDQKLTKDITLDLNKLFNDKNFPVETQVFLLSDILTEGRISFRDLNTKELQQIQVVNLYNIGQWGPSLFSRNEGRDSEVWNNFIKLQDDVEVAPFNN